MGKYWFLFEFLYLYRRKENEEASSPEPLSKQVLVTPSWRNSSSSLTSVQSKTYSSSSNPNINSMPPKAPMSNSRHTIWDIPERKVDASPVAPSASLDSKPNYFPTKSNTHFSFIPKSETKPGTITPAYTDSGIGNSRPSSRTESLFDKKEFSKKEMSKSNKYSSTSSVQDIRKSCLKTQSTQSLKSRSQSPSNVKFSPKIPKKAEGKFFFVYHL